MLTLPHTLAAAVIVKFIPNPFVALPLCLASHFFLDFFVIHWNPHLYTEFTKNKRISSNSMAVIAGDTIAALAVCAYILFKFSPDIAAIATFAAGIFLATLPDTVEIPYYFLGSKTKWMKKYIDFQHQHQSNGSVFWGIVTQITLIAACSLLFFF